MKKILLIALLAASLSAFADSKDDFNGVVDFSSSLEVIDTMVKEGKEAEVSREKVFLIEGAISLVTVVDRNPGSYLAEIEIITGRWIGLERVIMSKCIIRFSGSSYAEIFPYNPRNATENTIYLNDHIFAACVFSEVTEINGEKVAVFEGFQVRKIY